MGPPTVIGRITICGAEQCSSPAPEGAIGRGQVGEGMCGRGNWEWLPGDPPTSHLAVLTTVRSFLNSHRNVGYAMGATMPFSRYPNIDAGLMDAMRAAFHRVCEVLQLNCDTEDRLTEIVVTRNSGAGESRRTRSTAVVRQRAGRDEGDRESGRPPTVAGVVGNRKSPHAGA